MKSAYLYNESFYDIILQGGEKMGKTSTASKNKYNAKTYDQLRVVVKKGEREVIKARAEELGLSLNAYINKLIHEDLEKS